MDERKIGQLATSFRLAIDRAKQTCDDVVWLERFPKQCCDHTSQLLFLFLYKAGFRGFQWVRARIGDDQRHVWLQLNGMVIDITADQFPDVETAVVASRDSAWHATLSVIEQYATGALTGETEEEYFTRMAASEPVSEWYAVILHHIE